MRGTSCALSALLSLTLAACALGQSPPQGQPQAWIDFPVNGSQLPFGPVDVISHATWELGLDQIEVSVDGSVLGNQPGQAGQALVTFHQPWMPAAPGPHLLSVRALSSGGVWGPPANALVTILGRETLTPLPASTETLSPTPTETITLTPSPSASPTQTATLTPVPALGTIEFVRVAPTQAYYHNTSCGPKQVNFIVQATHPSGISLVSLFVRLKNQSTGATTEWQGHAMAVGGNDLFSLGINFESAFNLDPPSILVVPIDYQVQYQAVVQTPDGDTSLRTPIQGDVQVSRCN